MSKEYRISFECMTALLDWYRANKRNLPWRQNKDAYHVWVSEIMLQQTRVSAVIEYYKRFFEHFPEIAKLAHASEEELLKVWEGLGYYSRIRNMQKAAIIIESEYGGVMPLQYDLLIKLPGIGPYTAGAISSIVGGEKAPAVDGNVLRVITRLSGNTSNISKPATVKEIQTQIYLFMDKHPEIIPGELNQALMELGALVCIPNGHPQCEQCPFSPYCFAYLMNETEHIPVKEKPPKRRIEEKTLILLESSNGITLHKRPAKGLLAGMYEFPSLSGFMEEAAVLEQVKKWGYHPLRIHELEDAVHIFSHIEWHMKAYLIRVDEVLDKIKWDEANDFCFVSKEELKHSFPLPSAFEAYRKYIN